ncbi:hypothetical protein DICA3_F28590 [Diutina catenulata]
MHFSPFLLALAVAEIYNVEDGTTYITVEPDKFADDAEAEGFTYNNIGLMYQMLYDSFSGSIPLETLLEIQTNTAMIASLDSEFEDFTKTKTDSGGAPTMGYAYGAVIAGLGLFLL